MNLNRRHFLKLLGTTTVTASIATTATTTILASPAAAQGISSNSSGPFSLPPLPYAYDALEPYIDADTMRFHHDRHHAAYVNNLNAAIGRHPQLVNQSAIALLTNLDSIPEDIRSIVRNNGGGHINHSMFWEIMTPKGGGAPTGNIATAINDNFGSFAVLKQQFNDAGLKRFGSGWVWLVLTKAGKLEVTSTPNQDSPFITGDFPILGNDLWEHAYYLKYQNLRGDYLNAWWNVINWAEVNKRLEMAIAS
jgi:Fe-Mn family superoxide dismutase